MSQEAWLVFTKRRQVCNTCCLSGNIGISRFSRCRSQRLLWKTSTDKSVFHCFASSSSKDEKKPVYLELSEPHTTVIQNRSFHISRYFLGRCVLGQGSVIGQRQNLRMAALQRSGVDRSSPPGQGQWAPEWIGTRVKIVQTQVNSVRPAHLISKIKRNQLKGKRSRVFSAECVGFNPLFVPPLQQESFHSKRIRMTLLMMFQGSLPSWLSSRLYSLRPCVWAIGSSALSYQSQELLEHLSAASTYNTSSLNKIVVGSLAGGKYS